MLKTFRFIKPANIFKQVEPRPFSGNVGIIGVPWHKGQDKTGSSKGPDAMRNAGLMTELQELGVKFKDYGNVQFDECGEAKEPFGIMKCQLEVGKACQKVSQEIKKILSENQLAVTIGGDHSMALGTVHGHTELHDVCVLWVDAHGDINTPSTTLSGLMHGLPCSFFIEEFQRYIPKMEGYEWITPKVKKNSIAYLGLRDIDPLEKLLMVKENILHYTMADVDRLGIRECTRRALAAINPMNNLSLHVSFDIDAIDKVEVPSTGTPVLGGLTMREALIIAEEVCQLENFRALDVMEINPDVGLDFQVANTLQASKLLIRAFLGHTRAGSLPPDVTEVPLPDTYQVEQPLKHD